MEIREKTPEEAPDTANSNGRESSETPALSAKQETWHQMTPLPPCPHKQLLQKNLREKKRALQEEMKIFGRKRRALRAEIKAFRKDNKTKALWEEIHNFKLKYKGSLEDSKNIVEESRLLMTEINHFRRRNLDVPEKLSVLEKKTDAFEETMKAMLEELVSFKERNKTLESIVKAFQVKNQEFQETNRTMQEKNKSLQEKMEALEEKNVAYWKDCKAFWRKDKILWEEGLAISRDTIGLCQEYITLIENNRGLKKELRRLQNMMKALDDAENFMPNDISGLQHSQGIEGGTVENEVDRDHDTENGAEMCD